MATSEQLLTRMNESIAVLQAAQQTVVDATEQFGNAAHRSGNETLSGTKTFSSSPLVPTPAAGDNSTKAANTQWVKNAILGAGGAPQNHAATETTYGVGNATNYGHVKISDATNSTSAAAAGIAASPKAVKTAFDLANTAKTEATEAKELANSSLALQEQITALETAVAACSPDVQASIVADIKFALDMASLAMKEHEQTRLTRFQELRVTVKNCGVKHGVELAKSTTTTRNISCSDGVVFMDGREYPVANQTNTAAIASNTTNKSGVVIIYMFKTANNIIDVAATTLNEAMPEGGIELARATVPAGNTEVNDPHLANVTITDSARREPGWPTVQKTPATATVALNRVMPDVDYQVYPEIISCTGGGHQAGEARVRDKLKNGFKLCINGTADNVDVRMTVMHPAM